jgi:DNA topoisomerase-1
MPKSLVVVESPAKAKTINKFLGKDYRVMACMGHVRDLPTKELGIDVDNGFEPKYQTIRGKGKVLQQLRSAAKSADRLILATDPDREGEAIAWHVARSLPKVKDVARVLFNEVTERAIQEAVSHAGAIDQNKVDAQQARRVLDRLVGYKVSPLLWKTVHGGLSAGRVQSVALRMICEREAEIEAFRPQEYWSVDASVQAGDGPAFKAGLNACKGEKVEIPDEEAAARIVSEIQAAADSAAGLTIDKVTKREQRRNPAPPFITSTLQQEASRRLRFTARKTMAVAQQLYEGIELEGEATGLITYMRTDSTRLADEAVSEVRDLIRARYGKDFVPGKVRQYRRGKAAQDAHEAIRPTSVQHPPEAVASYLTPDQAKLYRLIWDRFVSCQMTPAVYDRTTIDITAGDYGLRATGSILKFAGFTAVYTEGRDDEAEEAEALLPEGLASGDRLQLLALMPEQHFTKPPPRYTEATLVKDLEAQEIGRPSTYAQIISTLLDKDYVSKDRGRFVPSDLGKTVSGILVDSFPDIFNVNFTARMEDELDQVESGSCEWVKVVEDFYGPFKQDLDVVDTRKIKKGLIKPTGETCEKCGKPMVEKWGRNGRFVACSGFPECRNTRPLEDEGPVETDETCEKCGAPMIIRSGRNGRFLACSAYPDCKNTRPISTGVPCPKAGCTGHLVERSSRRGKVFYGCSNYPDCDFATWDRPLKQTCPSCDGPYLAEHANRRQEVTVRCLKCRHVMPSQADPEAGPEAAVA